MAYLFLPEPDRATAQRQVAAGPAPDAQRTPAPTDQLTPLEWSVVGVARTDGPGSLRPTGWGATLLRAVLKRPNPMLADARLEALRRIAVLSWRHGCTVPSHEVSAFLAAGFTPPQHRALVDGISAARAAARNATIARRRLRRGGRPVLASRPPA